MKVTFLQAFILTMGIIIGVFGGGILIGTFCNPYLLIPYFTVLAACGIWYYNYINRNYKKQCPSINNQ